MTQEKLRRVITAAVVAGTLLFIFLLGVIIYQTIRINVLNNRIEDTKEQITQYQESIEKGEHDLEYYESDVYKFLESIRLGLLENP
ncbi:MAG: hypothetical protein IJV80_05400 [Clostridia bacterium]|nr:hypothetical protein [Clostridia bacterium]